MMYLWKSILENDYNRQFGILQIYYNTKEYRMLIHTKYKIVC